MFNIDLTGYNLHESYKSTKYNSIYHIEVTPSGRIVALGAMIRDDNDRNNFFAMFMKQSGPNIKPEV